MGVEPPRGLDPTWFIIGTLALAWVGVVAAATFAIGARSRLREVGLVAASSGTQRQVRPPRRLEVGVTGAEDASRTASLPVVSNSDVPALERTLVETLGARRVGAIWSATAPGQPDTAGAPDALDDALTVQVATPGALVVLGVTDTPTLEAFAQGSALRIDREAVSAPATLTAANGTEQQIPVADVRTGTVGVLGTLAVPPQVADRLGLTHTTSLSVIVDLGHRVRDSHLARAHAAALRTIGPGYKIWTSTQDGHCCNKRVVTPGVLGVGLTIALPVLGLVAALTRSEAQAELAVLDAVGIAPRRRRRFAATGMGRLATFATALALPAGLIPATLYLHADSPRIPGGSIISVPTSAIAALMLGVPLLLAATGWLTAGRPRPLAALRT